jgi:ribosome-binding factor A
MVVFLVVSATHGWVWAERPERGEAGDQEDVSVAEKKRAARVVGRVQLELMSIVRREIRDPRVQDLIITRVDMPDDLQLARVYVRNTVDNGPAAITSLLRGLSAAKGKLRSTLAKAVKMKYAPELVFFFDDGQDAATRIDGVLEEIAAERKERPIVIGEPEDEDHNAAENADVAGRNERS